MTTNHPHRLSGTALKASCTLIAMTAGLATPALGDDPLNLLWDAEVQTVGFQGFEHMQDVAVDAAGNVYAVGRLTQPINPDLGEVNAGGYDGVLMKFDAAGNRLWYRYLQTSQRDRVEGVCVDGAGNVYVTGYTAGDLAGFNQGDNDNFVAKYDSSGNQQWVRQFGTNRDENAYAVAADSAGNVYITGSSWSGAVGGPLSTTDLLVAKYDSNGSQQWLNYYGTLTFDNGRDIAVDADGSLYICGDTRGDFAGLPNPNPTGNTAMVIKLDANGNLVWTNIFGAFDGSGDAGYGIALDQANGVYVTGTTGGNIDFDFNPGTGADPFIGKFSKASGAIDWIDQRGSDDSSNEGASGVAVDDDGMVYHVGYVTGSLHGPQTSNLRDGFIVKYDTNGNQLSSQQFGYESHWYTIPQAAAARGSGELYISGWASHQSIGASDIGHVWKFTTDAACTGDIADDFGTLGSDGMVSFGDFLALLGLVGPCAGGTPGCAGDIADDFGTVGASDGMVSFGDFLALLGLVGPCDN